MQRFIGLVKYLSKFLYDLSEMCEPSRHLTHNSTEGTWTHDQEDAAFERIKHAFFKAPVLSTSAKVTWLKAKGTHPKMGLVLY